eukprot:CAMPEP_0195082936 /NCGR_PEP_ID=MMETSP0448-20130528/23990_1 /TAXON_ID=66468 /ORGANISM="Heterocapsa triquestra, Strain CCMP 448" /LENGTH=36 /DNA_ID= /DNA_START= /DNA_END= /DNA_ORIENTATION=
MRCGREALLLELQAPELDADGLERDSREAELATSAS